MKPLYRKSRVIYNAVANAYIVQHKKFFCWKDAGSYPVMNYSSKEQARDAAIERARALLDSMIVWSGKTWG